MSSTYDQLASVPLAGDFVCANYSTTADIDAGVAVSLDTTNYVGDGTHTIPGVVVSSTATGHSAQAIGVTVDKIAKNGATGRVRVAGVAAATFCATVTVGAAVGATGATAAAGTVGPAEATYPYLGFAVSAGASGDPGEVLVQPGAYYHASGS